MQFKNSLLSGKTNELEQIQLKERQLWKLIYSCENDILREALCLLSVYFGNIRLAVFDRKRGLLATSVDGLDEQMELQRKIQTICSSPVLTNGYTGKKRYLIKDLQLKGSYESYLYLEYSGNQNVAEEKRYACLFRALAVATKMYRMEHECRYAAETDSATGAQKRACLLSKLEQYAEKNTDIILASIRVVDLRESNLNKGMSYMDAYLSRLAKMFKKIFGADIYRITGSSFCVLTEKELKDCQMLFQDVVDYMSEYDETISLACVALRYTESAIKSVYICEKNLKELDGDSIRVIRQPLDESDYEDFAKVTDTFVVR